MRLFLDAHIFGRAVGGPLRAAGHDVRAADDERDLDGWGDEALLILASQEDRIMVTFNVRHFVPIVRKWAAAGKHHAGCILVMGIDHAEFGVLLRALEAIFAEHPDQQEWRDQTIHASRGELPSSK